MLEPYGLNTLYSLRQVSIDDGLLKVLQCKWFSGLHVFHFLTEDIYLMVDEFEAILQFPRDK